MISSSPANLRYVGLRNRSFRKKGKTMGHTATSRADVELKELAEVIAEKAVAAAKEIAWRRGDPRVEETEFFGTKRIVPTIPLWIPVGRSLSMTLHLMEGGAVVQATNGGHTEVDLGRLSKGMLEKLSSDLDALLPPD